MGHFISRLSIPGLVKLLKYIAAGVGLNYADDAFFGLARYLGACSGDLDKDSTKVLTFYILLFI